MNFRYARHTNNLKPLVEFYTQIIGLEKLGEFKDHSNYNGVFLGIQKLNWHIEFTESNENANHKSDEDDLLVFYLESEDEFDQLKLKIKNKGISIKRSKNPYWNENGIEITDPDGFGLILTKKNKTAHNKS